MARNFIVAMALAVTAALLTGAASSLAAEVQVRVERIGPPMTLGREVTVAASGVADGESAQLWIRQDPGVGPCPSAPLADETADTYFLSNTDELWTDVAAGPFLETISFVEPPGPTRLCAWLLDPSQPAIASMSGVASTAVLVTPRSTLPLVTRRTRWGRLAVPRGWRYADRTYPSDHTTEYFVDPLDTRVQVRLQVTRCRCGGYASARRYLRGGRTFAGKRWAAWRWTRGRFNVAGQDLWTATLAVVLRRGGQAYVSVTVPAHQELTARRILVSALRYRGLQ